MAKRLMMTLGLVIAAILLGLGLSMLEASRTLKITVPSTYPAAEQTTDAPKPAAPAPQSRQEASSPGPAPITTGYLLREHEGRIAVFREGAKTPELIFDVYTRMLPEPDRAALKAGIAVQDYEELTRLIEDYIS